MSPQNSTAQPDNEVRFCYRCGKRVKRGGTGKCWYCGAPIERTIRPPRRCPFCEEVVGHNAVKCPHCKEWLDGRPSQTAQPNVTFVIDKAVIGGAEGLTLASGDAPPQELSARLSPQTLQAIEQGNPKLIDQPGIRALPAPEQTESKDATGLPPVRRQETAPAPVSQDAPPVRHVPREEPQKERTATTKSATDEEAGEESRYAECPMCHTEVLADDAYCYSCGMKLGQKVYGRGAVANTGSNWPYFLAALVGGVLTLLLGNAGLATGDVSVGGQTFSIWSGVAVFDGMALLSLIIAWKRVRLFFSRFITILLGLFCLLVGFVALTMQAYL